MATSKLKKKAEPKTAKVTRVRLDPETRKQLILDVAADLVSTEGVSALSMERLGREAGISKSLVYAYYPSLKVLLQTLLKREYRTLRGLQIEAAEKADTFVDLVRRITRAYMTYMSQRGLILERLSAEPSVADSGDPTEYNRETAVNYLAQILHENYDFDSDLAHAVVDISFGLPAAGGHYLMRHNMDRETIEDITVNMIIGSVQAVSDKHSKSLNKAGKKPKIKLTKKFKT